MLVSLALLPFYSHCKADTIVTNHTISDDGYVNVPLQFPFPFYDQVFTNSWMFSNGVVGFLDPRTGVNGGQTFIATPFSTLNSSSFKFMIMPLWTDLINYGNGTFRTTSNATEMKYEWINISEYGVPNNLNTFDLTINNLGNISTNYTNVNITQHPVGVGYVGDLTLGQSEQTGWYPQGTPYTTINFPNWTANPYSGISICASNPLANPSCPGYADAYAQMLFTQQCTSNPLYDSSCPGYADAYFSQQCTSNPLYDSSCPGYADAYLTQQCTLNPLYDSSCPGYAEAYLTKYVKPTQDSTVEQNILPSTTVIIESTPAVDTTSVTISAVSPIAAVNVTAAPIITLPEIKQEVKQEVKEKPKNEKIKESVIKEASMLAEKMGQAASLEDQKNAQNQVMALIGFNPDFTAYNTKLIEIPFYVQTQMPDKKLYDSKKGLRNGLAQQILHDQMVELQYLWYK